MRALRRHIYLEEAFLVPPLRAAGAAMPVPVMLREHGELWRTVDSLSALIGQEADSRRLEEAFSGHGTDPDGWTCQQARL